MTIVTNRWSPDTCGCELEYTWDTEEDQNKRVHNFSKVIKACPAHDSVVPRTTTSKAQLKKIYDTVLEENQRNNQALAKALEVRPELADIRDPSTGNHHDLITIAKQIKQPDMAKVAELLGTGTVLKQNINYKWKWVEEKAVSGKPRTLK